MANNIVAFIGSNSFDIILYLSRILYQLGRKVLVMDFSDTKAITYSIPQIQGIDTNNSCITFRHIDFTTQVLDREIKDQYDDVLIDYGFSNSGFGIELLTRIVFVTDMYEFNMKKIGDIHLYDKLQVQRALLIREAANTKITTEYIVDRIKKNISDDMISVIYRDDMDYENGLLCHYNQIFCFKRISWILKSYLMNEVSIICPDLSERQIKVAYLKARKG